MKKITLLSLVMIVSLAFIGCETTSDNANMKVNGNTLNENMGAVVNDNANVMTNKDMMDKDLTREDFDKDKAKYEKEAKDSDSTIGTGANDLWLWTKARTALAGVDELRDSTINVDVANEVVTLKGTVGTKAQSDAAAKAAMVEGAKSVKNELKVDAKDSMTNQMTSPDKDDKMDNANAKSDK